MYISQVFIPNVADIFYRCLLFMNLANSVILYLLLLWYSIKQFLGKILPPSWRQFKSFFSFIPEISIPTTRPLFLLVNVSLTLILTLKIDVTLFVISSFAYLLCRNIFNVSMPSLAFVPFITFPIFFICNCPISPATFVTCHFGCVSLKITLTNELYSSYYMRIAFAAAFAS